MTAVPKSAGRRPNAIVRHKASMQSFADGADHQLFRGRVAQHVGAFRVDQVANHDHLGLRAENFRQDRRGALFGGRRVVRDGNILDATVQRLFFFDGDELAGESVAGVQRHVDRVPQPFGRHRREQQQAVRSSEQLLELPLHLDAHAQVVERLEADRVVLELDKNAFAGRRALGGERCRVRADSYSPANIPDCRACRSCAFRPQRIFSDSTAGSASSRPFDWLGIHTPSTITLIVTLAWVQSSITAEPRLASASAIISSR